MNSIRFTKKFLYNLELYWNSKKSLVKQIYELRKFFEINWFAIELFKNYNVVPIWKDFFRVKFIPYRVILKVADDEIVFIDLFKRKWKSDYKKYNS